MIYTKQAIKLFEDFSIFMSFLNFEHTKKQSKNCKKKKLKEKKCYKQKTMHDMMHEPMILSIGSIDAWTYEIIMHEYPSSPTHHVRLG